MSNRLTALKNSLAKKEALFDEKIQAHFETVKQANGQPLNDKRNGRATMAKWDKQSDSLRAMEESIQKTKDAIEREERKIAMVDATKLPDYIEAAIKDGLIVQWRKFPRFFFVTGVEKGRIVLNEETGKIDHRYVREIPTEQYPIFRDVFNKLNAQANNRP